MENYVSIICRNKCDGLAVVDPKMFFPASVSKDLLERRTSGEWNKLFKKSMAVSFGQYEAKILRPKNYGNQLPAHAYLGHNECSVAFYSQKPF